MRFLEKAAVFCGVCVWGHGRELEVALGDIMEEHDSWTAVLQQAGDERKEDIYPRELSEPGCVSVTAKGTIYL